MIEQQWYLKAFVTKADSIKKVQHAYIRTAQISENSEHIMCAYSLSVNDADVSGYVDDGEHGKDAKLRST